MENQVKYLIRIFIVCSLLLCTGTEVAFAKSPGKNSGQDAALLNRIDFGNSYIMGQSIKSGAVYLLQRKKSEINNMLEYRTEYRDEILEDFQFKKTESKKMKGSKKY